MLPDVSDLRVSDGGPPGFSECGDPQGIPIIFLHGAPGSRLEAGPDNVYASALASAGVRYIGVDRAGYGQSAARPARTIFEAANDVTQAADQLGLATFGVIGWSMGGPYALAVAARFPGRVSAVGTIASFAPIVDVGLEGCGERGFLELAAREPDELRSQLHKLARQMRSDPATTSLTLLGEMLSEDDVAFVLDPAVNPLMMRTMVESATADYGGYTDDFVALVQPWGFALSDVMTRVELIHGRDDRIIPIGHSRHLAQSLPNARLEECDGGHISVLAQLIELVERVKTA